MKYIDYDEALHAAYAAGRGLAPDVIELWMREAADLVAPEPVESILDLGAGTGRFSGPLSRAFGGTVIAIDPSVRMLSQGEPIVRRVVATAERLPFPDHAFDLVFASMVVHHIADLDAAISEVHRVLRPAGSVLVRMCFADTLDPPYHRYFPSLPALERDLLPTEAELVSAMEAHSLVRTATRRVRQRMDDDLASYARRIAHRAMSPLRLISDEEFRAGVAALEEEARSERVPTPVYEPIDLLRFEPRR